MALATRGLARPALVALLRLFLFSLPVALPQAQDALHRRTNYYAVTGSTIGELRRSMRQSRPWKDKRNADAYTDWRVAWRFKMTRSPKGWECIGLSTGTYITITLPRWAPPTNAPVTLRDAWQRFITALEKHEDGHAQFAIDTATEIRQRVSGVGPGPDASLLKRTIDTLCQAISDKQRRREQEYDQQTQHGQQQGVHLSERRRGDTSDRPD